MTVSSVKTGELSLSFALNNNFMEPIATTLLSSSNTTNIVFNDIPQTYKHLQLRCLARSARSDGGDYLAINLNSDFGTNYSYHRLTGFGSTVEASGTANGSLMVMQRLASDYYSSSIFSVFVIDILDYANTNKFKTIRSLAGLDSNNADGRIDFNSGNWRSLDSITSIYLTNSASNNFKQYSRFSLYGIKG